MTFIVTYRGADGAVREERVEAANRAECFSKCRAKGILPLGMEESRSDGKTQRSIGKTQRSIRESERSISKTQRSILIAALVVVVLAGMGFWLWTTRSKVTMQVVDEKPKKTALAKEVTPAKAPTPVAELGKGEMRIKKAEPKEERPRRVGEFRDGYVLLPSGELRKAAGIVTSCVVSTSIADTTFKHTAERMIGHLLLVEPGEGMLGDGESLYANFNEEFKESLKDEIVFSEEDTPAQHELKAAMIDIRKDLVERMNRGEDLAKVMIETRKQLQELALYKTELEEQVEKLKADGNLSKQDRLELLESANKMLEERGIKPFLIPSSLQHLIDIREAQKK